MVPSKISQANQSKVSSKLPLFKLKLLTELTLSFGDSFLDSDYHILNIFEEYKFLLIFIFYTEYNVLVEYILKMSVMFNIHLSISLVKRISFDVNYV